MFHFILESYTHSKGSLPCKQEETLKYRADGLYMHLPAAIRWDLTIFIFTYMDGLFQTSIYCTCLFWEWSSLVLLQVSLFLYPEGSEDRRCCLVQSVNPFETTVVILGCIIKIELKSSSCFMAEISFCEKFFPPLEIVHVIALHQHLSRPPGSPAAL